MPPASQPDGVPKPREAEPPGQSHGVIFGSPRLVGLVRVHPVGGNGPRPQPQPLGTRATAGIEVQAWMVSKNLQAGPDDEQHEDDVEEVLPAQPPREPRVDGRHVVRAEVPGYSRRKSCIHWYVRNCCATAMQKTSVTIPIGISHNPLTQWRPDRTDGACAGYCGTPPAQSLGTIRPSGSAAFE